MIHPTRHTHFWRDNPKGVRGEDSWVPGLVAATPRCAIRVTRGSYLFLFLFLFPFIRNS